MEKPLEMAWVDLKFGWGRVLGNHQSSVNGVSHVDGYSDMVVTCQLCGLVGAISGKEQCPLPASPPALTLMPDNSALPFMSLVPFQVLLQQLEFRACESEEVCVYGSFKRN